GQLALQPAGLQLGARLAEALQNQIALWVLTSLFSIQLANVQHALHPAVVMAELLDVLRADTVGTAVAHPDQLEALRLQTYRHQRAPPALTGRVVFGSLADRLMRCRSRLQQLIAGLYALRQHLQRQGTGDFATLVTAHTVGDGP